MTLTTSSALVLKIRSKNSIFNYVIVFSFEKIIIFSNVSGLLVVFLCYGHIINYFNMKPSFFKEHLTFSLSIYYTVFFVNFLPLHRTFYIVIYDSEYLLLNFS